MNSLSLEKGSEKGIWKMIDMENDLLENDSHGKLLTWKKDE